MSPICAPKRIGRTPESCGNESGVTHGDSPDGDVRGRPRTAGAGARDRLGKPPEASRRAPPLPPERRPDARTLRTPEEVGAERAGRWRAGAPPSGSRLLLVGAWTARAGSRGKRKNSRRQPRLRRRSPAQPACSRFAHIADGGSNRATVAGFDPVFPSDLGISRRGTRLAHRLTAARKGAVPCSSQSA
jgi:hypothetical protein